jgi:hypothetical protein
MADHVKYESDVVDPLVEDTYWRDNYANRPYASTDTSYSEYAPAYRYGWESRGKYAGRRFEEVESDLEQGWEKAKAQSKLAWSKAKVAVRDAWNRVEEALPGDSDRDGR